MANKEIEQDVAMDMILEHLIKNKHRQPLSYYEIQKDIFRDIDVAIIRHIVEAMANNPINPIVEIHFINGYGDRENKVLCVKANAVTEQFLYRLGGYKKYYQQKRDEKFFEKRIFELEFKLKEDTLKTNKLNRAGIVLSIVVSVIALIISFWGLLNKI